MSALIFIAGLAIGVSAFLYILSVISGGMNKFGKSDAGQKKIVKQTVPPGTRICPLCGSELTKYEGLYASKITEKSENKIIIMGCKYCFKDK
ncbi:MAG: hypothetical protein CVV49_02275 [Spirochaetae bacterium HGW-Spirochaetae-5]|nr:MAG: hypothetical protein CVV49_02275 [Spirochaetae bacterium HGW-Spirochaetae-5]